MIESKKNNIHSALEIAENLINASIQSEESCENETCFLVYSILKDCGYQVKKIIEAEQT